MRFNDARPRTRLLSVVALIVTFSVVVIAADWGLLWSDTSAEHPPHGLAAGSSEFALTADHEHIRHGATPADPDTLTAAVLPRVTPLLAALLLIAAVVVPAASCTRAIMIPMRGPPRALAISGQQLLNRFCISRR